MSLNQLKPKVLLNGIFGVWKRKGDSLDDYNTWIRLTHYFESRLDTGTKKWNSPSILVDIFPRFIEPFTTGVLCVGIGHLSTRLTALTQFWPHEWTVCAQLGTQTQHFDSQSPVVNQMPFDHISEDLLLQTVNQFVGQKEQLSPPFIGKPSILLPKDTKKKTMRTVQSQPILRLRECHSIDILSFKPPDIKLRVISDGYFSCRQLVHDLGLQLSSCAHLTDLCLNRMGPIDADVCLQKYEIHLNQMSEAIDKYSKLFFKDLKRFEDLKPDKRRFI